MKHAIQIFILCCVFAAPSMGDDGYRLWLRYDRLKNGDDISRYVRSIKNVVVTDKNETGAIIVTEMQRAMQGLLGEALPLGQEPGDGSVVFALFTNSASGTFTDAEKKQAGADGYLIRSRAGRTVVGAASPVGLLYGAFHFIRLVQTGSDIANLNIIENPKVKLRLLNHWDNLDRTVERGYAGASIWDWHKLPDYIDQRYIDYARANASLGINGTVLTNVNANATILREDYLQKVAALANVFRPYGIKVYLTARFSAPIETGALATADPLDAQVQQWWIEKCKKIYELIPDFGGFLVKANSEGQPGPQNFGRSHADGANMLAKAVQPYRGVVIWRAFVYTSDTGEERTKQAYSEFKPLDGKFEKNVIVQVKNGPLDFQPREPYHPLFGAMPLTPLALEFQITQEYLGFASHLVYLGTLFKETLYSNTHLAKDNARVANVIDGSFQQYAQTAISGVANIGSDRNWTGHPFGQANWYAYGRLAWNHQLDAGAIAKEWCRMTLTTDDASVDKIAAMMMKSRDITTGYMTPLGLHHIMGYDHHYGPAPWVDRAARPDWTCTYYHQAGTDGIGFNRTKTGTNALAQYPIPVQKEYEDPRTCPESLLLWFHHLPWDHKMRSGRTLWEELCFQYYDNAAAARQLGTTWHTLKEKVDDDTHRHVSQLLTIQAKEADWWRDACLSYFEDVSKRKIPAQYQRPEKTLDQYKAMTFPFAPGIKPTWK